MSKKEEKEEKEVANIIVKPYTAEAVVAHEARVGGKRNLKEVVVTDDETDFYYLVKRPTRSVLQAVTGAKDKSDINGASKILMGCVLEGDMEAIEHNGAMYLSLVEAITTLIGGVRSEIKKL